MFNAYAPMRRRRRGENRGVAGQKLVVCRPLSCLQRELLCPTAIHTCPGPCSNSVLTLPLYTHKHAGTDCGIGLVERGPVSKDDDILLAVVAIPASHRFRVRRVAQLCLGPGLLRLLRLHLRLLLLLLFVHLFPRGHRVSRGPIGRDRYVCYRPGRPDVLCVFLICAPCLKS